MVDPSTYDQVIEACEPNSHLPGFTSLHAAEESFAALCCSNDHDDQLILLVFLCTDVLKIKLMTTPIQHFYLDYLEDGTYPSAKDFLKRRFEARRSSPNTVIFTWFIEESDTQGAVQLMTARMIEQIELHQESMSLHTSTSVKPLSFFSEPDRRQILPNTNGYPYIP